MRWFYEEGGRVHEGYVVGLVEDQVEFTYKGDGPSGGGATYLRELSSYADHDREVPTDGIRVAGFQVGCDCGWRSRRFVAPYGARWYPSVLELGDEAVEAAAVAEWRQHVENERARERAAHRLTPLAR